MRKTTRILSALLVSCGGLVAQSHGQLTEINWGGTTGTRDWHTTGNWVGGVVPNTSLSVANLAVNLGSNLSVDLGATDATVAQLRLGSQSGAVTTNVTGSTGRLIFLNEDEDVITATEDADFDNSTTVDGRDFLIWQRGVGTTGMNINNVGDADGDQDVDGDDLAIWQLQYGLGAGAFNPGAPGIESKGVAGVTNIISAPIHITDQHVEVAGTRPLAINGNITYEGSTADPTVSNAGLEAMSAQVVTINSTLTIADTTANENVDFALNNDGEALGTIVLQGGVAGTGKIVFGRTGGSSNNLGTIVLNQANTFSGSVVAGLGNLRLEHDGALGTGTYTQSGPVTTQGYNIISNDDSRTIANELVMAQWQTIAGSNSITFSGHITQTNNRGIINQLPAGKTVTISGDLDIWEDDEVIERRFVIDGSGRTLITGTISDDALGTTGQDRRIQKTGTGVLVIDVDAGDNNHSGPEVVNMGNLHYADNDSLNVSTFSSPEGFAANIRSIGGAVGVDQHPPGQTLATNTTFHNKFDPISRGGLMLAASDANVNLNFDTMANVGNMSLAAPETGITYTGTITPNSALAQYRLGGGTGTLTLPNAQLTGANGVSIRNGGTVRLLGANSYTGATVIESKYTSSNQIPGEGPFIDDLVDPTLEVNTLANGGVNSSIGASSSAAANLYFHAGTLKYVGAGSTTDRLFTIGTGGGTIDSSGTGPVVFSNAGAAVSADAADITGTLDDFTRNPNVIYDVSDSRDVIIGMTARDPDGGGTFTQPPCEPNGANCIPEFDTQTPPEPTVATGVSDNGREIGLSANYPFILKENTRIVLGTVERTLTLTGSNTGANVLTPVIANSAKGGVVDIVKQGSGTWLLNGQNTTTGATTVEAGTLGGDGGVGGSLTVNSGAIFAPGGTAASLAGIDDFSVGGSFTLSSGAILGIQLGGTSAGSYDVLNVTGAATLSGSISLSAVSFSPAIGNQFTVLTAAGGITDSGLTISGLTGFTKSIVGNSLVLTKTAALSALASVPEPSALVLLGVALGCFAARRR